MHNQSSSPTFLTSLIPELHSQFLSSIPPFTLPCLRDEALMLLLSKISTILLLIHISCFLLIKLITIISTLPCSRDINTSTAQDQHKFEPVTVDEFTEKRDLIADVIRGGEDLLFLCREGRSSDTLLAQEFKDSKEEVVCFEVADTPVPESAHDSLVGDCLGEKHGIIECEAPVNDVSKPFVSSSPIVIPYHNPTIEGQTSIKEEANERKDFTENEQFCHSSTEQTTTKEEADERKDFTENKQFCHDSTEQTTNKEEANENKDFTENEKLCIIDHFDHSEMKNFQLAEVVHDKESLVGSSVTGGSTSKSSIEWRSSTIFRDSETEYPFTSSSRRSSSKWESYTVYHKYEEEMMFFDRISAQKLIETDSFRSIKVHPRSISQRIVHQLKTNNKNNYPRVTDPYHELESAYVAQICLAWEALNWNYNNFQRLIKSSSDEDTTCPAEIAQQFQQFQVLLQRFIESEPFERGRRPEVFARVKTSSPKLLRVPEFYDDEAKEGTASTISSVEFLAILGDAIRTFKNFLEADKESPCQKFRAFIKKKPSSAVDPTFLHLLRKVNRKKKLRIKELGRTQNCLIKKKLEEQKELEITMGLIDMKIVSRVLRMPEISEEQLHWCEEKMCKVRVRDGKIHRDSSTLFFPAH